MKLLKIVYTICLIVFLISLITPLSFAETKHPEQKITFNFVDVEIPTVIKFISEITSKNFIFDENVKGKITIIAPTKLSVDESFALFTSVLELKGFTLVPSGTKAYKIIPASLAKQEGKVFTGEEVGVGEEYITRLLPLENIKTDEAVKFLQPLVSKNGHISAFGPGNLLLVVDSALNIDKLATILKNIDKPPGPGEIPGVNVYPLENADATELAKVLDGIIKNAQAAKKALASSQIPFSDTVITPDKATNSLIILTDPADYQNVVQVIKALDKRRRQVFVEAMIVEVSIDKLKDLGAKWRATVSHSGEPVTIAGFGSISTSTLQSIINGLTGFTMGGMGNFLEIPITTIKSDGTFSTSTVTTPGFAALFGLSDFKNVVNVLSTPQILTSDNEEAEIVVGENVPFITARETSTSATNALLTSVQRQDVGIRLKITPQITEGDYVKLNLYQEISALKEQSETLTAAVGPTTTKRSTKTSVVVKDLQTVIISGLMQEKEEESLDRVPVLGDMPLLGWLFKNKTTTKTKTNLLVFLTPHIVKDSAQLAQITDKKQEEFAMKEQYYVEGELLIKFKEGVTKEKALEIISQKGASVKEFLEGIGVYHILLKPEQRVEDAIKEFSSMPEVQYTEPNYKIKIQK